MENKRPMVVAVFASIVLSAGCATPPERVLSDRAPAFATLPNGFEPMNPAKPSSLYAVETAIPGDNLTRYLERKHGHALNVLSLSGGGQNGAFGAGFLVGWREAGTRPEFDIVGGVSTGALLSTHALLGTPADDEKLVEMYTRVTRADIYRDKSLTSLIAGTDSLKDTTPLRELIARYITADTLARVAAAHDDNRLLVVGTTNIDYGQTWIWNMSLIAKAGDLELYRNVLLASASFPIVFPPVEIDGHLFVDGAARSNVVVVGMGGIERPSPPLHGPGNVYLISNGRLTHPPEALRRILGSVAATTVGVMMDQSMQNAVTRTYFGSKLLGYGFNMVAIPEEVDIGNDPLAFDPVMMRAAFDAGRALAQERDPWVHTPADVGDVPAWALRQLESEF